MLRKPIFTIFFLALTSFTWGQEQLSVENVGTMWTHFSPDSKYLLGVGTNQHSLYDLNRGRLIRELNFSMNSFKGVGDGHIVLIKSQIIAELGTTVDTIQTLDFEGNTIGQLVPNRPEVYFNTDYSFLAVPALHIDTLYMQLEKTQNRLSAELYRMLDQRDEVYDQWRASPEGKKHLKMSDDVRQKIKNLYEAKKSKVAILSLPEFEVLKIIETELESLDNVDFHANEALIYVRGEKNKLQVIDINSGAIVQRYQLPAHLSFVYASPFSPDGKKVLVNDEKSTAIYELGVWDKPIVKNLPLPLVLQAFTDNSRYLGFMKLPDNGASTKLQIVDLTTGNEVFTKPVADFKFHPNSKWVIISNYNTSQIIDFTRKNDHHIFTQKSPAFIVRPTLSPDGRKVIYLEYGGTLKIQSLDELLGKKEKRENVEFTRIEQVHFLPNGALWLNTRDQVAKSIFLDDVSKWDPIPWLKGGCYLNEQKTLLAKPDLPSKAIVVHDADDGKERVRFTIPDAEQVSLLKFSPFNKYLVAYCFKYTDINLAKGYSYLKVFDLERQEFIRDIPIFFAWPSIIFGAEDHLLLIPAAKNRKRSNYRNKPNNYFAGSSATDGLLMQLVDLRSAKVLYDVNSINPMQGMVNLRNNKLLYYPQMTDEGKYAPKIVLYDLSQNGVATTTIPFKSDHQGYYHVNRVLFTANPNEVVLLIVENKDIYNTQKNKLIVELFNVQTYQRKVLAKATEDVHGYNYIISDDLRYYLYLTASGIMQVFDLQKTKLIAELYTTTNGMVIRTPDNYYLGDKTALDILQFSRDGRSYPARQFDLKYNRPDIVLSRFPESDPALIEAYRRAYEKRLQKMGFALPEEGEDFHLPELKITNDDIPGTTDKSQFALKIHAQDDKYQLDRINVWINDIPVFGKNGYSLKGQKINNFQQTFNLTLSPGNNRIQVSCFNGQGTESLLEEIDIDCQVPEKQPTLYLIALGAAEYKNPTMNLKYPTKDGRDLVKLFRSQHRAYQEVVVQEYYDGALNQEQLAAIKAELMKSKIEDKVILFYAGHGLVDAQLDYYLATSNTDFGNPQGNAIPYEMLEDLFDGIPARNRLLLIDACHSGEIDKETTQLIDKNAILTEGNVTFRSFGDKALAPKRLGFTNSLALMKELFVDLRRGTGATVISSASGVEFALEGDQWQNGVYTYSLLRGLEEMAADLNGDGEVMVSELQQYLSDEVSRLTEGHQRPTMRVENLLGDWRVW